MLSPCCQSSGELARCLAYPSLQGPGQSQSGDALGGPQASRSCWVRGVCLLRAVFARVVVRHGFSEAQAELRRGLGWASWLPGIVFRVDIIGRIMLRKFTIRFTQGEETQAEKA